MDIEKIINDDADHDDDLLEILDKAKPNMLHSKIPLNKLKNNLRTGLIWGIIITLGYIALFFFIDIWQVIAALGVVAIFNVIILIDSWKLYKKIPDGIIATHSLKDELTLQYKNFQRWWKVQQKISVFVYPIALTGGFILGGAIGSGETVESFLYNSKMLIILSVTLVVLVPLSFFSARWMFRFAYGKHLEKLKSIIDELEENEGV